MPSLFEDHAAISFAEHAVGDVGMLKAMESLFEGLPGDARKRRLLQIGVTYGTVDFMGILGRRVARAARWAEALGCLGESGF